MPSVKQGIRRLFTSKLLIAVPAARTRNGAVVLEPIIAAKSTLHTAVLCLKTAIIWISVSLFLLGQLSPRIMELIRIHLGDIAMGRLQGNGSLTNGVIPIQYRRVACPKVGNAYIWLRPGAGPYYLALTVVNTANMGSVVRVEARGSGDSDWVEFQHDPNYSSSRPQERYGAWVLPQGAGPLNLPVGIRVTAPNGDQIVNDAAITSFTAPSTAPDGFWYIDMGTNFS